MSVTLCYPYYDNPGILQLHLDTWMSYAPEIRDQYRYILVDDASPNSPAESVIRAAKFDGQIELYRIERNVAWGWPAAKNIAMHHAPDGPALVTDIDMVLESKDAEALLRLKVKPDAHYIPRRRRAVDGLEYKRHPSTYVMQRSLFWTIGGFEERWLGLYGSDSMMRRRAGRMSRRIELDDVWVKLYGREVIADASTTEFGRKGSEYHKGEAGKEMQRASDGPVQVVMSQKYHRVL